LLLALYDHQDAIADPEVPAGEPRPDGGGFPKGVRPLAGLLEARSARRERLTRRAESQRVPAGPLLSRRRTERGGGQQRDEGSDGYASEGHDAGLISCLGSGSPRRDRNTRDMTFHSAPRTKGIGAAQATTRIASHLNAQGSQRTNEIPAARAAETSSHGLHQRAPARA